MMAEAISDLEQLKTRLRAFAAARDWGQFHTPKNLAMALIVEAAELVEHFQWLSPEQSAELAADKRVEVEEELADIQIYLVRIADRLGVDILDAVSRRNGLMDERIMHCTETS